MKLRAKRHEIADIYEWNELAFANKWTDGIPVLPATEEKVAETLAYVGRKPDEEIGEIPPRDGVGTLEKLAIQAVMAGCKPEYFPVVLAAIEAMLHPRFNLNGVQCTAHICAPLTIVSGPIVEALDFNSSYGLFGGGSRANATVGRAIRLILWNIGGGYTGNPDRSSSAHPGRYLYCIAENQAGNPWPPLHVDRGGLPAEASAVTVFACESPHYCQYGPAAPPHHNLNVIADVMTTIGHNNAYTMGEMLICLSVGVARAFKKEGWTKAQVQAYLHERARNRFGKLRRSPYFESEADKVADLWPRWVALDDDESRVPVVKEPQDLIVMVAGGVGGPVVCPGWGVYGGLSVTREIVHPPLPK